MVTSTVVFLIVDGSDTKLAQELSDNVVLYPKETPDDASLLWRFVGSASLLMSNGEQWRKQSILIDEAFNARIPIEAFTSLAHKLSAIVGKKFTVIWDKYAQCFALDAVGSTVLGHNFDAIETDNLFVQDYNGVMVEIADPVYLIFPWMERAFPRRKLMRRIDTLVDSFMQLLTDKKGNPGDDMMTFMLKDPAMSHRELRDNMITLFIGGHVRSSLIQQSIGVELLHFFLGYGRRRNIYTVLFPRTAA